MAVITFEHQGSFENTDRFLSKMRRQEIFAVLDLFGRLGVDALASARLPALVSWRGGLGLGANG